MSVTLVNGHVLIPHLPDWGGAHRSAIQHIAALLNLI